MTARDLSCSFGGGANLASFPMMKRFVPDSLLGEQTDLMSLRETRVRFTFLMDLCKLGKNLILLVAV